LGKKGDEVKSMEHLEHWNIIEKKKKKKIYIYKKKKIKKKKSKT